MATKEGTQKGKKLNKLVAQIRSQVSM